jgi:hypothetical protein
LHRQDGLQGSKDDANTWDEDANWHRWATLAASGAESTSPRALGLKLGEAAASPEPT